MTAQTKDNGRQPRALQPASSKGGGLMNALLELQAAAPRIQRDCINPHFRSSYASLKAVNEELMPLLSELGLHWATFPTQDEHGQPALIYRLTHVPTGEAIEETMPLCLGKQDSQGLGSAITYGRRYSLMAALNLVADEDDDGNAASAPVSEGGGDRQPSARAPEQSERRISAAQRERLLKPAAKNAKLTDGEFANVILVAQGAAPREWNSPEHASQTLARLLEHLPVRFKDAVLQGIEAKP